MTLFEGQEKREINQSSRNQSTKVPGIATVIIRLFTLDIAGMRKLNIDFFCLFNKSVNTDRLSRLSAATSSPDKIKQFNPMHTISARATE